MISTQGIFLLPLCFRAELPFPPTISFSQRTYFQILPSPKPALASACWVFYKAFGESNKGSAHYFYTELVKCAYVCYKNNQWQRKYRILFSGCFFKILTKIKKSIHCISPRRYLFLIATMFLGQERSPWAFEQSLFKKALSCLTSWTRQVLHVQDFFFKACTLNICVTELKLVSHSL